MYRSISVTRLINLASRLRVTTVSAFVIAGTLVSACSTVESRSAPIPISQIQHDDRIQLLVRTGNDTMDRLLYEIAYQQFSDVLPLREKEPYTGIMEVTFTSESQSTFVASSNTTGTATAIGSGWYNGSGYTGQATATGSSNTVASGGSFRWQNSTMLIVIKRADGERLWSADYNYKGGWEMSGWVVNTPEEAARLVTKRLKSQFAADFHAKG